jgi:adenine deaminase
MLRLGSAWYDVASQLPAITELGLDPRHFILVTDDSHSGTLVHDGHMDRVVRHAIDQGLTPMVALQMATLNPAEHFGLARDIGQIAPGRYADIVLARDLHDFRAEQVIARGRMAASQGVLEVDAPQFTYPAEVMASVRLGRQLNADDFTVPTESQTRVTAHVIGVIENQAPTRHLRLSLPVAGGEALTDQEQDVAKVALVERHRGTGEVQVGFVQGFGINVACAFGSTVAHDSHHMLIVGTSDEDMAMAANELARLGGGQIVVREGQVRGLVELPIAGLMSDERAEVVAEQAESVLAAMRDCGCHLNNANMQLSLLALVVIPELRISDQGLVDVETFAIIPVVAEEAH